MICDMICPQTEASDTKSTPRRDTQAGDGEMGPEFAGLLGSSIEKQRGKPGLEAADRHHDTTDEAPDGGGGATEGSAHQDVAVELPLGGADTPEPSPGESVPVAERDGIPDAQASVEVLGAVVAVGRVPFLTENAPNDGGAGQSVEDTATAPDPTLSAKMSTSEALPGAGQGELPVEDTEQAVLPAEPRGEGVGKTPRPAGTQDAQAATLPTGDKHDVQTGEAGRSGDSGDVRDADARSLHGKDAELEDAPVRGGDSVKRSDSGTQDSLREASGVGRSGQNDTGRAGPALQEPTGMPEARAQMPGHTRDIATVRDGAAQALVAQTSESGETPQPGPAERGAGGPARDGAEPGNPAGTAAADDRSVYPAGEDTPKQSMGEEGDPGRRTMHRSRLSNGGPDSTVEAAGGAEDIRISAPSGAQRTSASTFETAFSRTERFQDFLGRLDAHVLSLVSGKDRSMTVGLLPPNLGRLTLSCHEVGKELVIEIVAENRNARALLAEHEQFIRDVVSGNGYRLTGFDVRAEGEGAGARQFGWMSGADVRMPGGGTHGSVEVGEGTVPGGAESVGPGGVWVVA